MGHIQFGLGEYVKVRRFRWMPTWLSWLPFYWERYKVAYNFQERTITLDRPMRKGQVLLVEYETDMNTEPNGGAS